MATPKEDAYDAFIHPLMRQIADLCREHKINMIATFALDNMIATFALDVGATDGEVLYCTTADQTHDPDDAEGIAKIGALSEVLGL